MPTVGFWWSPPCTCLWPVQSVQRACIAHGQHTLPLGMWVSVSLYFECQLNVRPNCFRADAKKRGTIVVQCVCNYRSWQFRVVVEFEGHVFPGGNGVWLPMEYECQWNLCDNQFRAAIEIGWHSNFGDSGSPTAFHVGCQSSCMDTSWSAVALVLQCGWHTNWAPVANLWNGVIVETRLQLLDIQHAKKCMTS